MSKWITLIFCLWIGTLQGLEYDPWYTSMFEFYSDFQYRNQSYKKLASTAKCSKKGGTDNFFTASLGLTPWFDWNTQVEFTAGYTHQHRFLFANDLKAMVRYQLTDDVIGDFFSSVVGLTVIQASKPARHDVGVFVHGRIGGEIHLSLGKEWAPREDWVMRGWILGAFGDGDTGAPWLRADAAIDTNYCRVWSNSFGIETRWGMGHSPLCQDHFNGYGGVRHQSIDLGWKTKIILPLANLKSQLLYRIFAHNCPKNAVQFLIAFEYPFGISDAVNKMNFCY